MNRIITNLTELETLEDYDNVEIVILITKIFTLTHLQKINQMKNLMFCYISCNELVPQEEIVLTHFTFGSEIRKNKSSCLSCFTRKKNNSYKQNHVYSFFKYKNIYRTKGNFFCETRKMNEEKPYALTHDKKSIALLHLDECTDATYNKNCKYCLYKNNMSTIENILIHSNTDIKIINNLPANTKTLMIIYENKYGKSNFDKYSNLPIGLEKLILFVDTSYFENMDVSKLEFSKIKLPYGCKIIINYVNNEKPIYML